MVSKIISPVQLNYSQIVKYTSQGNIHEIMGYTHKSTGNSIHKLDKYSYYDSSVPFLSPDSEVLLPVDSYNSFIKNNPSFDPSIDLVTDDSGYSFLKKSYRSTENRSQSANEIRKTFKRLRALINTNVTDPRFCKFITLTYKENMTDCEKLRHDLSLFMKRFRYYINNLTNKKGHKLGLDFEYISVIEPQERGAWHAHIIFCFNKQIRFIDNAEVARIWSHGFTTTRRIDNVDNVGAYLTAYLADIPLSDNVDSESLKYLQSEASSIHVKECSVPCYDSAGNPKGKEKKKFIKGGRLHLYPKGFHLYRCSKGIKRPVTEYITYKEVLSRLGLNASLTFHKSIFISDGQYFENTLTYMYFNSKRKVNREDARTSGNEVLRCAKYFSDNRKFAPAQVFSFSDQSVDIADKNTSDILLYLASHQSDSMRC